jgi:hypothetical protein
MDSTREQIVSFPKINRDDVVAFNSMFARVRNDNPFVFLRSPMAAIKPDRSTEGGILRFTSNRLDPRNLKGNDYESNDKFSLQFKTTHWL